MKISSSPLAGEYYESLNLLVCLLHGLMRDALSHSVKLKDQDLIRGDVHWLTLPAWV